MKREMRSMLIQGLVGAATVVLLSTSTFAEAKLFLYQLTNKYGDPVFSDEISPSSAGNKKHFKVEFDLLGRVSNYGTIVNGRAISTNELSYPGDSKFYVEFVNYDATGTKTNVAKIMRTPSGESMRREYFTVSGEMTSYTTYKYLPDRIELINFTADNRLMSKHRTYFDSSGIVHKEIRFSTDENMYYVSLFDPKTGLTTGTDKYDKGRHVINEKYVYNENNMLIRIDLYDPLNNNNWYGSNDYNDDLLVGKRYKFRSGATREVKIEYREDRISTQSWLYQNNRLICRFVFERRPNGSIIKTVAYDGAGDLMGEYANKVVYEINRDGSPLDGGEYKLYKKPVW